MIKTIKTILVLYKRSAFEVYFAGISKSRLNRLMVGRDVIRFRKAHEEHYKTLAVVEQVLKRLKVNYHKRARGQKINYSRYDLVVTVGGDGTFLEAARNVRRQFVLGVNSDPVWSVGQFCSTNRRHFQSVFKKILKGRCTVQDFSRVRIQVDGKKKSVNVLNDVLIAHRNPAAMSHYYLSVNGIKEEQRSSGVWIATAAGSSGAVHSAGGRKLAPESDTIQYIPRELHQRRVIHKLKGGVVRLKRPLIVQSLMNEGFVFVDGAHLRFSFPFGSILKITRSPDPLRVIKAKLGKE